MTGAANLDPGCRSLADSEFIKRHNNALIM